MVLGMGIVMGFLVLLIGAMRLMSRVAARFGAAAPAPLPRAAPAAPAVGAHSPDAALIAAIGAAIARFRQDHS